MKQTLISTKLTDEFLYKSRREVLLLLLEIEKDSTDEVAMELNFKL